MHNNPRSPIQSDLRSISGDSAVSASTGLSRAADPVAGGSAAVLAGGVRLSAAEDRTITATIELLKGGCLPGDVVPIKVSVQHIKRIKSLHGVIVTLYRQGRIDSSPPISLFKDLSKEDAKRLEKEEVLSKVQDGARWPFLTSAGPCSVFRKDLSQAFSPLLIDPATMSASINTSVRVPPEAFPTIKGVPGEMISFKYQIEVIVDLGGSLQANCKGGKPIHIRHWHYRAEHWYASPTLDGNGARRRRMGRRELVHHRHRPTTSRERCHLRGVPSLWWGRKTRHATTSAART